MLPPPPDSPAPSWLADCASLRLPSHSGAVSSSGCRPIPLTTAPFSFAGRSIKEIHARTEVVGLTDYPQADVNFPYRLAELTLTPVSKDTKRNPNHAIVGLTDPETLSVPDDHDV